MIITILLDPSISPATWDGVIDEIHRCTPHILVHSHGTLYAGTDTIDRIRYHVRQWSARAAMAPDRTSSRLCALAAVPGRLDAHRSAEHVSTRVLRECAELTIDDVFLYRLGLFGYSTIGSLYSLSERHLRAQFGEHGTRIYNLLHTTSSTLPLYQPPEVLTADFSFEEATSEPGAILPICEKLSRELSDFLAGREAWRIDVSVLDRAGEISARRGRIMRSAITTYQQIETHIKALTRQLLSAACRWWGMRARLSSLRVPIPEQGLLFSTKPSAEDIRVLLTPKYGAVVKDIHIIDPWSIIPEDYARITGRLL